MWAPNKRDFFFDMDSQKWGPLSVQKCNFEPKFANFTLKLPVVNFSKCARKVAICM